MMLINELLAVSDARHTGGDGAWQTLVMNEVCLCHDVRAVTSRAVHVTIT